MATWLYNSHPPLVYPYIRTTAAYLAVMQWYICLGQLPTAAGMKDKGQGDDTQCQMGCIVNEDPHHIFELCKVFRKWRQCFRRVDEENQVED